MPAILPDITATEALVIDYTNKIRQREKLGAVHQDKALAIAARAFAQYLAKTKTFSHTADGRQPAMRARARIQILPYRGEPSAVEKCRGI